MRARLDGALGPLGDGLNAGHIYVTLNRLGKAGLAGGYGLFLAASQGGSVSQPPAWWLVAAVISTMIVVTGLTSVPARLSTRPSIATSLQANA